MSIPGLLFAFLLASIYALAFFLLFGKGWLELGLYWLAALAGFAVGQFVTRAIGVSLLPVGSVNVIEASALSIIALIVLRTILRRPRPAAIKKNERPSRLTKP